MMNRNRRDNMGLNREAYGDTYNQYKNELEELKAKRSDYENKCNNVNNLIKKFNKNPNTQVYISLHSSEENVEIPLTKEDLMKLKGYYRKQQSEYYKYIMTKEESIHYLEDLFKTDKDDADLER